MMNPKAPLVNRQLIWHMYSGQAYGKHHLFPRCHINLLQPTPYERALLCPSSPPTHTHPGIFHGDLDFYFGGFDARDRVHKIDVSKCPIYFLTGVYDWSTTPEMSKATADKIKGANFTAMEGLGHFPATENPKVFVGYLEKAIDWILETRKG
jgi:pimeloyl-ACP methyl ester carboxylesterase